MKSVKLASDDEHQALRRHKYRRAPPSRSPHRRRRPDRRRRHPLPPRLPGRGGDPEQGRAEPSGAEPVHGSEPELEHPQRHLDDRRLQAGRAPRQQPDHELGRRAARALRLDRLRLGGAPGRRLPVDRLPATRARLRPGDAGDAGRLRASPDSRPAGNQAVPELLRRRLLLPRQQGPDVDPDQDRPHLRAQGRRRRLPDPEARLRPHAEDRRGDRADHLGAARLQRADLVRLQAERPRRDPRPEDRRAQGEDARRGDRELVRGRLRRRLHRLRQADVPLQGEPRTACRG